MSDKSEIGFIPNGREKIRCTAEGKTFFYTDEMEARMSEYDNGYDEGYRFGMQKMREFGHGRIEELEEQNKRLRLEVAHANDTADVAIERVEELEAKLAKAVEALQGLVPILCEGFEDGCGKLSRHDCAACEGYATLAELTGGKDE